MSSEPLFDIDLRRMDYGDRPVLGRLRLAVATGELVALVGASGCGKSTLLRIAAGLERHFEGQVQLDGKPLHGPSREMGVVFQEPRLFPWLTVAQNVAFMIGDDRHPAQARRVADTLAEVGLAGLEGALPKRLSGGQAQRVALARALIGQPRLLLLDEPFSAVDAFTRLKLQDLLAGVVRRHGLAALIVTHDIDEALRLADRVLVLDGRPARIADALESGAEPAWPALRARVLAALQPA